MSHVPLGLYVGSMRRFCVTESDVMGLISGETRTVTVNLLTSTSRPEVCYWECPVYYVGMLNEICLYCCASELCNLNTSL